ncbi:enoyl-CoA hydratase-related protein, partial [Acinetobacter baumannii]
VKLGLLPGAGGTQRIPRVASVKLALQMTAIGDPIPAKVAMDNGLIDRLATEGNLEADAIAFAREVATARPLPRASEKTATADPEAVEAFKKA